MSENNVESLETLWGSSLVTLQRPGARPFLHDDASEKYYHPGHTHIAIL